MDKPGNKKKAEGTPGGGNKPNKKSKKQDMIGEEDSDFEEAPGVVHNLPQRVVAVQRLKWNSNRGKERWLAYGGAAGLVRCQYVLPRE